MWVAEGRGGVREVGISRGKIVNCKWMGKSVIENTRKGKIDSLQSAVDRPFGCRALCFFIS